jgi:pyruvate dehydrogenase E2 component (dihydrolipoamide acetyltransferase)
VPYEILMPQLGLTMTEGAVTTWLKNPGERVEKGDLVFTVQTDKVEMEVESFGRGYLDRILVSPGQVVPVGTVIALLCDQPPGSKSAAVVEMPAGDAGENSGQPVSPRARRAAKELNVDLAAVKPSNGKRISEEDVRRYHEAHHIAALPQSRPAPGSSGSLSAIRKITAKRMTSSFQSAPHFYLGVEANAGELVKLRESSVANPTAPLGVKLTYTDFFLKALTMTLMEQPNVNESWRDNKIVRNESIDIGLAAQTREGLLVPVIRNTERLSLFELARERSLLTRKALAGGLSLAEMEGGSATLSNLGSMGIDSFQAILNPPQSVILATGRIAKRPVVVEDQVQAQFTVMLNLSADHRVLDGVAAAKFLARIRELIEAPSLLLV